MKHARLVATTLMTLTLPLAAQAHPGHEVHAGFVLGVMHPFTGWDHLAVLMCLGLLAAGRGAKLALGAGALLALSLAGGAMLGISFPETPFVEPAILASVIASVALLFVRAHIGRRSLLALCLCFTLIHGIAHGQESPSGDLASYFAGFTLAGVVIFAAGALLGERVRVQSSRRRART